MAQTTSRRHRRIRDPRKTFPTWAYVLGGVVALACVVLATVALIVR